MPPIIRKIAMLIISSFAIWIGVGMAYATGVDAIFTAAAILAFLGSMALWLVFGLDQIGVMTDETGHLEKAKRDSTSGGEGARLALMLSLMTPDERGALKARLAEELRADGETLTLADLLAEQDHIADRSRS